MNDDVIHDDLATQEKKDPMKSLSRKMKRRVLKEAGMSHKKTVYEIGRKSRQRALSSDL